MGLLSELDRIIWDYEVKQRDSFLKNTDAYRNELKGIYEEWVGDYLKDLETVPEEDRREYIAAALLLLGQQLKERQRRRLLEAFNLGLAGDPPSPESLQKLADHITEQEWYVDNSLVPDLEVYFLEHVGEPDYREGLLRRAARVGLYAGAFWAATQRAQIWISHPDRECTWISRDDEATCKQCHSLHMKKFTVSTLPATPGVDVECDGNCRCYILFSDPVELWPYMGRP